MAWNPAAIHSAPRRNGRPYSSETMVYVQDCAALPATANRDAPSVAANLLAPYRRRTHQARTRHAKLITNRDILPGDRVGSKCRRARAQCKRCQREEPSLVQQKPGQPNEGSAKRRAVSELLENRRLVSHGKMNHFPWPIENQAARERQSDENRARDEVAPAADKRSPGGPLAAHSGGHIEPALPP